jgi:hypothetical protein
MLLSVAAAFAPFIMPPLPNKSFKLSAAALNASLSKPGLRGTPTM